MQRMEERMGNEHIKDFLNGNETDVIVFIFGSCMIITLKCTG